MIGFLSLISGNNMCSHVPTPPHLFNINTNFKSGSVLSDVNICTYINNLFIHIFLWLIVPRCGSWCGDIKCVFIMVLHERLLQSSCCKGREAV